MVLLDSFLAFVGLLDVVPKCGDGPVATVKNGSYVGVYSPQYRQDFFLGIPYAQKPVRFMNSQHLNSSWEGTREAIKYPLHCVGYGPEMIGYESSEDCLYLNVIRPAGIDATAELPVAVWFHGGGLLMGGSADKRYNLSFIVERSMELGTPMLGVSLNYRMSVFGFPWGKEVLDAGVGNLGFKDQRLALRWINENIGAFGGSKDKVTIFGQSSGAESTSAQTYAYDGRDDGLFRAAIGQSGFAGPLMRYPGGLNATEAQQQKYDSLVNKTSCASTVKTPASLECLRTLPFAELDAFLSENQATVLWGPVMDGDFIANYPSVQLREAKVPKIPLMIGCNTDEGTGAAIYGPLIINTDTELRAAIAPLLPDNCLSTTGKTVDQLIDELMDAYPNDQAVGIPGLDKLPLITNGSALAQRLGLQYRRVAAVIGDINFQYTRRRTSIAWSNFSVPSWSYRFDVPSNQEAAWVGATHMMEIPFVLYNLGGYGYEQNPFANATAEYLGVAKTMSAAWISFVVDPHGGPGAGLALPGGEPPAVYDAKDGAVGENIVFAVNGTYLEKDDWRHAGMAWMAEHSLTVFGN